MGGAWGGALSPECRRWSSELSRFPIDRYAIAGLLLAMALLALTACGRGEVKQKSACEGLEYTEDGIAREAYLPCAGEILAAMDALRPEIEAAIDGDDEARKRARRAYRYLRNLLKMAGGRNLMEEWRDRRLTDLNLAIYSAYTNYWATTIKPDPLAFQNAEQHHEDARRIYEGL